MTFNFDDIMIGHDDDMDNFAVQQQMNDSVAAAVRQQQQQTMMGSNNMPVAADTMTSLGGMNSDQQLYDDNEFGDDIDGMQRNDFEIPERFTMNGRKKAVSFPLKLMKVLSMQEYQSIVSWLPCGKQFHIVDRDQFTEKVLSKHFKQAKYSSFTRKLFRWGFERVGHLRGKRHSTFCHPYFQKGRVDLVDQMTHSIMNHTNQMPPALMGGQPGPYGNGGQYGGRQGNRVESAMFNQGMMMGGGRYPQHQMQHPSMGGGYGNNNNFSGMGGAGGMPPHHGGMQSPHLHGMTPNGMDMHMAGQQQQQSSMQQQHMGGGGYGHHGGQNSFMSGSAQRGASGIGMGGMPPEGLSTDASAASNLETLIEIEVRKRLLKDKLKNANMYRNALSNVEQQIQELGNDPMLQGINIQQLGMGNMGGQQAQYPGGAGGTMGMSQMGVPSPATGQGQHLNNYGGNSSQMPSNATSSGFNMNDGSNFNEPYGNMASQMQQQGMLSEQQQQHQSAFGGMQQNDM